MFICVYIYAHTHTHTHTHTHISMYIYIHVYILHTHTHTHTHTHVCVYIYTYEYIYTNTYDIPLAFIYIRYLLQHAHRPRCSQQTRFSLLTHLSFLRAPRRPCFAAPRLTCFPPCCPLPISSHAPPLPLCCLSRVLPLLPLLPLLARGGVREQVPAKRGPPQSVTSLSPLQIS